MRRIDDARQLNHTAVSLSPAEIVEYAEQSQRFLFRCLAGCFNDLLNDL